MTMSNPLALHTWTLDTTPLADVLTTVKFAGWDAIELRRGREYQQGVIDRQLWKTDHVNHRSASLTHLAP